VVPKVLEALKKNIFFFIRLYISQQLSLA